MRYDAHRQKIKSGDLLAWSARKVESLHDLKVQAIRVFDRTEYTHVGLAWVMAGRVWVVESVTPLVRLVPLSSLLPCYHTPLMLRWTPEVEQYALSFVGNEAYRYSQLEAIRGFIGRNKKSNRWLECAEFVQMVAEKAGRPLEGRATPSDVVLAAQRNIGGGTFYLEAQ